jgi:hypothetical protein
MLPHAVDDHCKAMGGYWTGHIDHGCTAWVARMMYRYYRYTMDEEFLRGTAWPFMRRAMRVYEEMLEQDEHGAMCLPVSVSPEYRGKSIDAWGENASFQLAAIHRLLEDLLEAAEVLDEEPAPAWRDIQTRLPRATLARWKPSGAAFFGPRLDSDCIALWKGQLLEASHRHHSHMAGLYPFDVIDPCAEEWAEVVENTLRQWVMQGPGLWSGWCMPWAAILHTRIGNGDMAELLLEIFERVYTNEGGNTFHDPRFPGFSLMGAHTFGLSGEQWTRQRMQIDAQMAAATAVQEMLLSTRRRVNYLFAGAPARWDDVSFDGMRTDGAFLVSATRHKGRVQPVTVQSTAGGTFRLANPWEADVRVIRDGKPGEQLSGDILEIDTEQDEEVVLEPATR